MNENGIPDRIKCVVDYSKKSLRKFAMDCGLKQSTLDKHVKGLAEPNATTLCAIAKYYPEISLKWLLLGDGEMLKVNEKPLDYSLKYLETIGTLNDALAAQGNTIKMLRERIAELESKN